MNTISRKKYFNEFKEQNCCDIVICFKNKEIGKIKAINYTLYKGDDEEDMAKKSIGTRTLNPTKSSIGSYKPTGKKPVETVTNSSRTAAQDIKDAFSKK